MAVIVKERERSQCLTGKTRGACDRQEPECTLSTSVIQIGRVVAESLAESEAECEPDFPSLTADWSLMYKYLEFKVQEQRIVGARKARRQRVQSAR